MKWYDNEPELWVMIVTGAKGSKAFSAGADLKEWLELYDPEFSIVFWLSLPPVLDALGEEGWGVALHFVRGRGLIVENGKGQMARVWDK